MLFTFEQDFGHAAPRLEKKLPPLSLAARDDSPHASVRLIPRWIRLWAAFAQHVLYDGDRKLAMVTASLRW